MGIPISDTLRSMDEDQTPKSETAINEKRSTRAKGCWTGSEILHRREEFSGEAFAPLKPIHAAIGATKRVKRRDWAPHCWTRARYAAILFTSMGLWDQKEKSSADSYQTITTPAGILSQTPFDLLTVIRVPPCAPSVASASSMTGIISRML